MAKVSTEPRSGKRGTVVILDGPYGQVERPRVPVKNPRTPAQQTVRGNLARMAARWRTLTEAQRAAWIARARQTPSRPRLGQSGPLTGLQLYIKINCARAAIGLDPVDTPPDPPKFASNPVGALTITNTDGDIAILLKVPRAPAHPIMVLATAPCSAGVSRPRRFTLVGTLPAPTSGVSDITGLCVARYGVPPVRTRIFIRTRQVADGWEDLPKETTAVVPAA
jgi:hypothetical protein